MIEIVIITVGFLIIAFGALAVVMYDPKGEESEE